ncbi:Crp/Fnr family transcriptional regulator [Microvirga guangxiensis]|uniref:cAMP-binding domain of CRP or a regulatory subunit of cAMP-dependent protein kinases n=1 Tax=Microvirga guangxiensis TaxID=549386 RepID=A0A1G5HUA1_9HYPH|nr:Crp/Fnr family transcriptional regulator [Microvirga guangxiensis]SCY66598.1 cAMP-binding domain of CRP or a regulatory subunit of cAMP-dependent protein kinases [Microvirga guangxiensis]
MHTSFHRYNPMIRKLESIFKLTEDERQALENLPMQVAVIKDDQDIVREGDCPSRSCLILSGFTATYKITAGGKRQIVAFGIAGDIPDLQSLHLKVLDISLTTLTPCQVGFITHEALRDICTRYPRIAAAFWRETLVEGAIFREWVTNVGRREGYNRMAHMLCELLVRLRVVGLAEDHTCDLPITQSEFADALGVTTVHVNRVLQQLRADGLIKLKGDRLNIPDWDRLKEAGEFDPAYLHLENNQAAA